MKIAVPTEDGVHVSSHFGRCAQFLVFEAQDGRMALAEKRSNQGCHGHAAGSDHGEGQHQHQGIMETLRDCQVVLCAGIGARAVEALHANGMAVVFVEAAGDAAQLAAAYQSGDLRPSSAAACQCHHS